MDLTTYIREGHFEREVKEMTYNTKYHNLIYHASGRKDPTVIKEFQKSVIDWIATIKSYSSVKKSSALHSSDDKIDFHTLLPPHKDTWPLFCVFQ